MPDFTELSKYIWLMFVAIFGSVVSFFTKVSVAIKNRPYIEKIRIFVIGVISSMFVSYITYELMMYFFRHEKLSVAVAGLAAFTGTDIVVVILERFTKMLTRKIDRM